MRLGKNLRARKRPTAKRLLAEQLEDRVLLAGDADLLGGPPRPPLDAPIESQYTVDGSGNNLADADLGSTNEQLLRLTTAEYEDGVSTPAGADRPSAREVSNAVAAQSDSIVNDRHLTDLTWLFGQFIDHDIDLTTGASPAEEFNIEVPTDDVYFDPLGTGVQEIGLERSVYDTETGDEAGDPRQQLNVITSFLDGSVIYGSDQERADALRDSGGRLAVSDGDLLPFNTAGLDNAGIGGDPADLFLAGDVRANENAALTAMHTVWVREHNRLADEISAADPNLTDDEVFLQAKAIVVAQLQAITFNEFLPALLGAGAIDSYDGYDPSVDPSIANIFSTAAYRFGHSMLSTTLLRLNEDGTTAAEGDLSLSDAFFAPDEIVNNGIDSILRGAAAQNAQEIDTQVIDDVRNFLFGPPGAGGFDLASLNIQRGRDHGLADYNQARVDYGLTPVTSFSEITSDAELAAELESLYGDVDNVDAWVGGLAEDHLPGSSVGEFIQTVLADQFERIRDGDRFWYQNVFSGRQLAEIENTMLAEVIERNTGISDLQDNVFYDSSVLYYRAPAGQPPAEVAVVAGRDDVRLVDSRSGRTLAGGAAASVSQVILVGSQQGGDRFTVDLSRGPLDLADGLVIDGGGRRDELIVRGGRQAESFAVDDAAVVVNDLAISHNGVERIRLFTGRGPDQVTVAEGMTTAVEVDGRNRPAPPPRPGDGPNDGGPNDGGPNDGGPNDGGPDDGGRDEDRDRDRRERRDLPPPPAAVLAGGFELMMMEDAVDRIAEDRVGRRRR